jgi:hypothetical protein
MFQMKTVSLSMLALLGSVGIAVASSGHPDAATVRAALAHRGPKSAPAGVDSQAAATKASPLVTFSMLGSGTAQDPVDGTCSGATCDASAGDCECIQIAGSLNGTDVGTAPFNASVTVNVDDCTNTGTSTSMAGGFCCFGDGVLATVPGNGSSPSNLGMSFTATVCNDPNANASTGGDESVQGGFIILSADSSGKFASSAGAGQINLIVDTSDNVLLSGNGVLQLDSSF